MCGIAGHIFEGVQGTELQALLRVMCDRISHRGPDSAGYLAEGGVGLGMRRLKVIDLEAGNQPMFNEDRTISVIFNGEIYNHSELRNCLTRKGHKFASASDTEVIVHQYEEDREYCVDKFRGMFAFALWDSVNRLLLLARDRYGIKPLFIAESTGKLAFASEMKALWPVPWVEWSWHAAAIQAFLRLGYVPGPMTAYKAIRKFEQGTTELWDVTGGGVSLRSRRKYWQPIIEASSPHSYGEARETLESLLRESVRIRLRSDVPLGAFLSGGVDSSCVVALMRSCGANRINTFAVGFEDATYNELPYAQQVAEHLQTNHTAMVVSGRDALDVLDLLDNYDEPFADASAIPTYFVSRLARAKVTVSLSGDGGDELFAGYNHYGLLPKYLVWDALPLCFRTAAQKFAAQFVPEDETGGGFVRRLAVPRGERLLALESITESSYLSDAIAAEFVERLREEAPRQDWRRALQCSHFVGSAQSVDQRYYLPDDILTKVDRSSMLVSLEARVPLLDHKVADYVNSLPTAYKICGGQRKRILKAIFSAYLPVFVLKRRKQGFSVPLTSWLRGPLSECVAGVFAAGGGGTLDPAGAARLLATFQKGTRNLGREVWLLFCLGRWAALQGNAHNRPDFHVKNIH